MTGRTLLLPLHPLPRADPEFSPEYFMEIRGGMIAAGSGNRFKRKPGIRGHEFTGLLQPDIGEVLEEGNSGFLFKQEA